MFESVFLSEYDLRQSESKGSLHKLNQPSELASDDWEKKLGRACQILSNLSDFSTLAGNFQIFKIFHSH